MLAQGNADAARRDGGGYCNSRANVNANSSASTHRDASTDGDGDSPV
jgi:hypothetical protein